MAKKKSGRKKGGHNRGFFSATASDDTPSTPGPRPPFATKTALPSWLPMRRSGKESYQRARKQFFRCKCNPEIGEFISGYLGS